MRIIIFILFMLVGLQLSAQDTDTTDKYVNLNEVVLSANKFTEKKKNIVQKIDVITARQIARTNAQNTGDLLMSSGNVFVQKSQQGGSSPVVRGFEASRVLLVIDGIRMNNAIYRSGHLQNVITVDQNMLSRVEVMHGPSSTMYGSDALGGTVHMVTKQPFTGSDSAINIKANAFARYSTVNDEKTGHADFNIGFKKLAFLTSFTYSSFGDMRMGSHDPSDYEGFGRRNQYLIPYQVAGKDTIVNNTDNRIQRYSGYNQWDIMQKLLYRQSSKITHLLNLQLSNTNNVPRYDRLTDVRNGALRYAEWYYGPQERNLAAYSFNANGLTGFFNEIRATLSYQDIKESRQTRDYKRYDRFDSRRENIKVWGAIFDLRKSIGANELSVGVDGQWNDLTSVADRTNLLTGQKSKLDTRYPDGKNAMNNYGIYAQHIYKFGNDKWVLNDGLRFQYVHLSSNIVDNSFFNLPVTNVNQDNIAVTGNLGLVYNPDASSRFSFGISSGFRAPNIDDLSKVFESSTSAKQVVVPNADIKPEYTYNMDLSYRKTVNDLLRFELTGFYTLFRNAIVKAPYQLNGQDSIIYNGVMSQVLANQNANKAYLYGGNVSISADLTEHFSFSTTLSYTYGRFKVDEIKTTSIYQEQPDGSYKLVQANVKEKPLDHIPPVFGKTSIQYRYKGWYTEFFALYNGKKKLDQYNPDGEDNAQYATPTGMPGWYTLNLRAGWQVTRLLQLQGALENILDRNYRNFASGFSSPGRNIMLSLRLAM
ncbi:MAG TPA: TonB-dependent receptor [Chitinophagaceae bacterium]|nr:TonB-dependent receptor [Chitinophagaceae bacterium]